MGFLNIGLGFAAELFTQIRPAVFLNCRDRRRRNLSAVRRLDSRGADCPRDCPCQPAKPGIRSQQQPSHLIGEAKETEGFTGKIEDVREADFCLATALRGSLEVFDLAHPAGQWVPSGENLGHHLLNPGFLQGFQIGSRYKGRPTAGGRAGHLCDAEP